MPLADLNPPGHHSSDGRWSTSSSRKDIDIPSTTVWEPDPSSESEHLVLLHPVISKLIFHSASPQRYSGPLPDWGRSYSSLLVLWSPCFPRRPPYCACRNVVHPPRAFVLGLNQQHARKYCPKGFSPGVLHGMFARAFFRG